MKIIFRGEIPEEKKNNKTGIFFECRRCRTTWIANQFEYIKSSERTPFGYTSFRHGCPVCGESQSVKYPNCNIPYISEEDCDD